MDRLAVLIAAVLPAILFVAYGRSKTRIEWGNEALWTAFMMGGVGAIASGFIEVGIGYLLKQAALPPLGHAAAEALLEAALVEEAVKFGILLGAVENHVDRRRFADIVMLALAVSLGFAAVENIFYVAAPADWMPVAAGRAISAVPGHGMYGLVMGAFVAWARARPQWSRLFLVAALALPVVMHAAYDFPLFAMAVDDWWAWQAVWTAAFAASASIAVALCNHVLPMAFEADRLAGLASVPVLRIRYLVIGVVVLMPVGLLFALIPFAGRPDLIAIGFAIAVLPLAFGFDFLFEIFRRRRMARVMAGADAVTSR